MFGIWDKGFGVRGEELRFGVYLGLEVRAYHSVEYMYGVLVGAGLRGARGPNWYHMRPSGQSRGQSRN